VIGGKSGNIFFVRKKENLLGEKKHAKRGMVEDLAPEKIVYWKDQQHLKLFN